MDTDAIWENASNNFEKKFGVSFKNMKAMGNYNDQWKAWCVQAYLSITSFRIPGQKKKGRKKDF
jgi:hypothetical protein